MQGERNYACEIRLGASAFGESGAPRLDLHDDSFRGWHLSWI
jgi:hypothetical protein